MAKSLTAPYEAGRRGAGWLKVKPVHTLDLVVLAVEWGSGRRRGKLSNIHLGARDPDNGGFVMLGKTFKGMTDAMLDWQTERFTELADGPTGRLRRAACVPSRSSRSPSTACSARRAIPGGLALRFARVLRYRDDKTADRGRHDRHRARVPPRLSTRPRAVLTPPAVTIRDVLSTSPAGSTSRTSRPGWSTRPRRAASRTRAGRTGCPPA